MTFRLLAECSNQLSYESARLPVSPCVGAPTCAPPTEPWRTTAAGFEPARAEPIGFQVQHLNHSVTLSCAAVVRAVVFLLTLCRKQEAKMRRPGIEPGPPAWKAGIITIRLTAHTVQCRKRAQGTLALHMLCICQYESNFSVHATLA